MVSPAIRGALRSIVSAGRRAVGLSAHRVTEDRRVLEQIILPAYAQRADIARVLFVGCAAYTKPYGGLFTGREYWTIDPVARRRRYGGQRHIVDRLENLGAHVQADYFDLIICNGVLGWGLNAPADAAAAFAACHFHLRRDGELVLGWNDIPPRNLVAPDDVPPLRGFSLLQRRKIEVAHRHVFDVYKK